MVMFVKEMKSISATYLVSLALILAGCNKPQNQSVNESSQTPLIPAEINSALGAVREGMTVEEVEKEFRVYYPNAELSEITGGIGNGRACIGLGDRIEIGLQVRSTSDPDIQDRTDRRYWVVANNSVIFISDYNKLQSIKVEFMPIRRVSAESTKTE